MAENSCSLIIPKGIVTRIYHAEKSGQDYLTITDGDSTFNIGSGELDLSKTPKLIPLRFEIGLMGFLYGKNQGLKAVSFKAIPVT